MKKKFIKLSLLTTLLTTGIIFNSFILTKNVQASSINNTSTPIINEVAEENTSKSEFTETDPKMVEKMKANMEKILKDESHNRAKRSLSSNYSLSSLMAKDLQNAGFTHSAYLLNYSMRPLREEPLVFTDNSSLSSDIWYYSPEFKGKVVSFLNEARMRKSHQYFKTTSMSFNMPSGSKANILRNTSLKKRTDLFGALHAVRLNLGVIKHGSRWVVQVVIEDRYDFAPTKYNSLVNIVNAMAYHDQERGRIKPYNLQIFGHRMNINSLPFGVRTW